MDAARFARPGTREPSPDWGGLGSFVLTSMAAFDQVAEDLPEGAVRAPLLELLDDEVDVTPGRYTAVANEPSREELARKWSHFDSLLSELTDHSRHLSRLAFDAGASRTATTVGDLVKAGALTLRVGQQPTESAAVDDGAAVPLLTITDLLHDGVPGAVVPDGSAGRTASRGEPPRGVRP
ncbi:hypothetical protein [Streptomyces sp. sk226]|uniref:hypothetical protein n=1 Tax=Streptomyces sp. sk226 TaxID=2034268 RepID=UPI000BEF496D|nr:hypothetical protein [Streptomyces sp. sk226]